MKMHEFFCFSCDIDLFFLTFFAMQAKHDIYSPVRLLAWAPMAQERAWEWAPNICLKPSLAVLCMNKTYIDE